MMPVIWVTKTATETFNKNSVIDGVQRTSTLYCFVNDKFKLHKPRGLADFSMQKYL